MSTDAETKGSMEGKLEGNRGSACTWRRGSSRGAAEQREADKWREKIVQRI